LNGARCGGKSMQDGLGLSDSQLQCRGALHCIVILPWHGSQ
jgi:hypothetical protein